VSPSTLAPGRLLEALRVDDSRVLLHESPTERAEAEHVVHSIEQLVGGHSFFSFDSARVDGEPSRPLSFADFAVLYRTRAQEPPLVEAFARSSMPFSHRTHEPLQSLPGVTALLAAARAAPEGSLPARLRAAATELAAAADLGQETIDAAMAGLLALPGASGHDLERLADEAALATSVDTSILARTA